MINSIGSITQKPLGDQYDVFFSGIISLFWQDGVCYIPYQMMRNWLNMKLVLE